jgi:hypothetical protein
LGFNIVVNVVNVAEVMKKNSSQLGIMPWSVVGIQHRVLLGGEGALVFREEEEVRAQVPLEPGEADHVGLLLPGLPARRQRVTCVTIKIKTR